MFKTHDVGKLRMSPKFILFISWIWLILTVSSCEALGECCLPNTTWQKSGICSDGSKIRLNCTDYYETDPLEEDDRFYVDRDQDGLRLVFLTSLESVQYQKFCILDEKEDNMSALICFSDDYEEHWRNIILGTVTGISSFFLILTLIVYGILPELKDIQDRAMKRVIAALAVGYINLTTVSFRPYVVSFDSYCILVGFIIYYAFLTAFFWINLVSFNIWRSVWFKNYPLKDNTLFIVFNVVGWGCPTCFLIAALITHFSEGDHLNPRFGEDSCWFGGEMESWVYFYGPIAILLVLNIVYLSLTSWRLSKEYRVYRECKLKTLRFRCAIYIKLVIIMGLTWIFELVSSIRGWKNSLLWIPTDMLNGLQGLFIFLLLVISRNRVKKLLAKRKPCGIRFPKSWLAQEDEECDDVIPEEVELSHAT